MRTDCPDTLERNLLSANHCPWSQWKFHSPTPCHVCFSLGKKTQQHMSAAIMARDMVLTASLAQRNLPDTKQPAAAGATAAEGSEASRAGGSATASEANATASDRSAATPSAAAIGDANAAAAGDAGMAAGAAAGADAAAAAAAKALQHSLFHDESLPSFFRRLAWSPDGEPSCKHDNRKGQHVGLCACCCVFGSGDCSSLPGPAQCSARLFMAMAMH